jgi:hypothetical protein
MSVVDHDQDFYLWTRQQADALRRLAETRPNIHIDFANVIEEIEDLGSEQEHAIVSHFTVVLLHLLKLAYSPDEQPRRHWRVEIAAQRGSLARRLRKNPSLKIGAGQLLADAYPSARRQMSLEYVELADLIPEACPFALDRVLDNDWFPEDATHA